MRHKLIMNILAIVGCMTVLYALWIALYPQLSNNSNNKASFIVERGKIESTLNFSGDIKTDTTANLTFTNPGFIERIHVREGDVVSVGQPLISLNNKALLKDRAEMQASLTEVIAGQRDLLQGVDMETKKLAETNVATAQAQLERMKITQSQLIDNARRNLLSNDLTAEPKDEQERTPAPSISGTYRCESEGEYYFSIFRSASESGFSIRVSGLEDDIIPLSFTQAVPFGTCGLRARFQENLFYNNTEWIISIPNQNSPSYILNRNNYETTKLEAVHSINSAKDNLELAIKQKERQIAPTREHQLVQANSRIAQIEARLDRINLAIDDTTLKAPFDGTVTNISAVVGEAVTNSPIITLLGNVDEYEIRLKIPEVDIAYIEKGQITRNIFDARPSEEISGKISYISPLPIEINGVTYFEARLKLDEQPSWLRTGLNSSVSVIITQKLDTLRVPTGYIFFIDDIPHVVTKNNQNFVDKEINILLIGSDGYSAISGIEKGSVVYKP